MSIFNKKNYTKIESRHLNKKEYCDGSDLMLYSMFEILDSFLYSEGIEHVDWYSKEVETNFMTINKKKVFIMDEMKSLKKWFYEKYLPHSKEKTLEQMALNEMVDESYAETIWERNEYKEYVSMHLKFKSKKQEENYEYAQKELLKIDVKMSREVQDILHRLVDVRPFMWT